MRKIVMAAGVVALLGGVAAAAPPPVANEPSEVSTHRLERWGFGARGTPEAEVAYRECAPDRLVSVNSRRTGGDWATALVTLGWYTPAHTTVRCTLPR